MRIWLLAFVLACSDKSADTHESSETGFSGPDWSILADEVGEGVLLSAYSAGEELLAVGGALGGSGPGVLARWDGARLCTETLVEDAALWWIHGPSETEWYAVGERGTVVHVVDGVFSREDVNTSYTLYGVWADEDGVWVVGGDVAAGSGRVWQRTEDGWETVLETTDGVIFKVWKHWVVGDSVAWFRLEDGSFEERPPSERLLTVRGGSEEHVWAVGGSTSSAVLEWSEGAWASLDTSGLSAPLNGIWTDLGQHVWVAGMIGTQAYSDDGGESWTIPDFPLTPHHFHAVWKHQDDVLFLGGNLMSAAGPWFGTIGRWGTNSEAVVATTCPSRR